MKEVTAYQSTLTQMDSVVVDGVWLTTRSLIGMTIASSSS